MDQRVAPAELGAHAFRIEIPALPTADVVIIEEFGRREETRAVLRQRTWEQITYRGRRAGRVQR